MNTLGQFSVYTLEIDTHCKSTHTLNRHVIQKIVHCKSLRGGGGGGGFSPDFCKNTILRYESSFESSFESIGTTLPM